MLFNSYEFVLLFLPITLAVYYFLLRRVGGEMPLIWVCVASLFFYAYWNPVYVILILASILINYRLGVGLAVSRSRSMLILGIAFNLGLLAYYKYANFFVDSVNAVAHTDWHLETILLPLAISFFTFQQISYLVDAYRGLTREYQLVHYMVFVTFFPQLIAGPIVHHREMMSQFSTSPALRKFWSNLSVGLFIFSVGLFKKVVIADSLAVYATPVFDASSNGVILTFFEAWIGALCYTFQLYFDFSGYSDMAIGIARMFGIRLPVNFMSPYKSRSISEFWRRWHITLSRFLRDYLYIPLGGARAGNGRKLINLFVTMSLGGLWHGAGWTFVIWGMLHGVYLIVNHMWVAITRPVRHLKIFSSAVYRWTMVSLTFIAVVVGWVFFRAESAEAAISLLASMSGYHGISLSASMRSLAAVDPLGILSFDGMFRNAVLVPSPVDPIVLVVFSGMIAFFLPNTYELCRRYRPAIQYDGALVAPVSGLLWRPSTAWSIVLGMFFGFSLMSMTGVSEFLYFQF